MNVHLAACITLSLAMHATLFAWTTQTPATVPLSIGGQAQALRVTLALPLPHPGHLAAVDVTALQQPAPAAQTPAPAPSQHPVVQQRADSTVPPPSPSMAREPREESVTLEQSSAANVRDRVSAALQNQLAKRFEYPWLARKRGWQGQVTLSLRITRDGALSDWQVARTSGYAVLDQSALKAARAIDHLPDSSRLLQGEPLRLTIPVQYQLLDS
jgi:protein TonB